MSLESAYAEGRSPTSAERAKHWRRIARELCARQEALDDADPRRERPMEENYEVVRALLRAVRYSIRCPEMHSIVDWAEKLEKQLYPDEVTT